jgi:hypothetical protein
MKFFKVELQIEVPDTITEEEVRTHLHKGVLTMTGGTIGKTKNLAVVSLQHIEVSNPRKIRRSLMPEERRVRERRMRNR